MMDFFLEKILLPASLALLVLIIIALPFALFHDFSLIKRLMKECLSDGKKEYECEAMLNGSYKFQPVPIVVPIIH